MYYNLRKFKSLDGPTKAQDVKDTSTEDELNARIEQLEDKQRKIVVIGGVVVGILVIALLFNIATDAMDEKAQWGA